MGVRLQCIEQAACAEELRHTQREVMLAEKRHWLQTNPFDPRTEVSADARHVAGKVVTHLWVLFVALPIVLFCLYQVTK